MVEIKLMKFGDTSPATEQLQHHCELEEVAVLNVGDGIARIYGLNNVQSGDS
jgi:F0F1-type ATP synthase alpha subunit